MERQTVVKATIWSFFERLSTQGFGFIIGIVLARLLTPHDYGVVGLTAIFIAISNVFIEAGFANALIRKIDRTEEDLSTAFYFNVCIGVVAYILLWICSPFIANYFEEPILNKLIKIVGLNVLLNSLCIVQTAILTAELNIRLQTLINVCAQVLAGIIAIFSAFYGWGVYALVLQTVCASLIKVCMLWTFTKWRPKKTFNKKSLYNLWEFGSKLLGANLIGTFFNQIYSVLIGKYIGKNELGYFAKSSQLNNNVDSIASGIIQKVALPVLTQYQTDKELLTQKFRHTMRLLVMVMSPFYAFFCFTAKDIIILIWTEKWIQSVVLFQILIIGTMFNPIGQLSLSLMQVVGRTSLILKLEFPKKMIYFIYIFIGFLYGMLGLVIAQVFINLTGSLINMWATKRILKYSYIMQLNDMLIYMVIAYPIAWIISCFVHTNFVIINILGMFFFIIVIYLTILLMIKDKEAIFITNIIKEKYGKHKTNY